MYVTVFAAYKPSRSSYSKRNPDIRMEQEACGPDCYLHDLVRTPPCRPWGGSCVMLVTRKPQPVLLKWSKTSSLTREIILVCLYVLSFVGELALKCTFQYCVNTPSPALGAMSRLFSSSPCCASYGYEMWPYPRVNLSNTSPWQLARGLSPQSNTFGW